MIEPVSLAPVIISIELRAIQRLRKKSFATIRRYKRAAMAGSTETLVVLASFDSFGHACVTETKRNGYYTVSSY